MSPKVMMKILKQMLGNFKETFNKRQTFQNLVFSFRICLEAMRPMKILKMFFYERSDNVSTNPIQDSISSIPLSNHDSLPSLETSDDDNLTITDLEEEGTNRFVLPKKRRITVSQYYLSNGHNISRHYTEQRIT